MAQPDSHLSPSRRHIRHPPSPTHARTLVGMDRQPINPPPRRGHQPKPRRHLHPRDLGKPPQPRKPRLELLRLHEPLPQLPPRQPPGDRCMVSRKTSQTPYTLRYRWTKTSRPRSPHPIHPTMPLAQRIPRQTPQTFLVHPRLTHQQSNQPIISLNPNLLSNKRPNLPINKHANLLYNKRPNLLSKSSPGHNHPFLQPPDR